MISLCAYEKFCRTLAVVGPGVVPVIGKVGSMLEVMAYEYQTVEPPSQTAEPLSQLVVARSHIVMVTHVATPPTIIRTWPSVPPAGSAPPPILLVTYAVLAGCGPY